MGDVDPGGVSLSSLRFQITQTGADAATYTSTTMASWSFPVTGARTRYTFPAAYSIANLAPGTYTFNLQVIREAESGSAPNGVKYLGRSEYC